ncbi:MAG: hypothetical protein K6T68_13715 [Alicyclobacillus shizuokensis]|nr:hypothetical protein [Alicyclobacillus shizuokensis]
MKKGRNYSSAGTSNDISLRNPDVFHAPYAMPTASQMVPAIFAGGLKFHQIAPHPEGIGAMAAMRMALAQAGVQPADIDYINAHATSTKAGDTAEIKALSALFGEALDHIAVSSIKGSIGHLLGAAGGVESLACVKALETGWLPPNLHCDHPEPGTPKCLVQEARPQAIRYALSNSFGFGGQNGVLLWKRYEE